MYSMYFIFFMVLYSSSVALGRWDLKILKDGKQKKNESFAMDKTIYFILSKQKPHGNGFIFSTRCRSIQIVRLATLSFLYPVFARHIYSLCVLCSSCSLKKIKKLLVFNSIPFRYFEISFFIFSSTVWHFVFLFPPYLSFWSELQRRFQCHFRIVFIFFM